MHALVNAFLRCLSFLLPPPWFHVGIWWVGDEHGKMTWSNPRARFKRRKPLTDQEVTTEAVSSPSSSSSAAGRRVSLAAPLPAVSSLPRGSPLGRIWELWQALDCNFGASFFRRLLQNQSGLPNACPALVCAASTRAEEGSSLPETELAGEEEAKERTTREEAGVTDDMSAVTETPSPAASISQSAVLGVADAAIECQGHEMRSQVTIRVAIQEAEDEDLDEDFMSNHLDLRGGSCSEDDLGRHDKSSGAGTSGGELEEDSWQTPDPELTRKLITQIEYYLSDENLERDAFLLKHVRRNKQGFVSVKLLTSFKKVKHLTRDWRTTAYALRHSQLLELNEEGRKVRRKAAVPVFASENLPSRMLLVSELHLWPELAGAAGGQNSAGGAAQQEKLMEHLLKVFGVYGVIASVRVLKAGKELPADLKKLSGRYTQLGTSECAIVEFEEVEAAINAHEVLGGSDVAVGTGEEEEAVSIGATARAKVILIGTKPPKKKVPKDKQRDDSSRKNRSLNCRVRELQYIGDDACSSSETESNPTSPRLSRKARPNKLSPPGGGYHQNNHLSPSVSPRSSPWNSPRTSPLVQRKSPHSHKSSLASAGRLSPEPGQRKWADYSSDSSLTPSGSPWVQRRRQVTSQESSPVGSPMLGRKIQNADGLPPGVVRLPRGPDGTRGFHNNSVGDRGKCTLLE
ncbi:la-related protein 6-like [Acipenser ruthenus]|uniref:la-related protein 6-like n=1 Tax=Acipenser ruthenus TaxID=7906 RepID=UPI0027408885|nr:la-related protein 6-like [Acipenser ruthenus]